MAVVDWGRTVAGWGALELRGAGVAHLQALGGLTGGHLSSSPHSSRRPATMLLIYIPNQPAGSVDSRSYPKNSRYYSYDDGEMGARDV